MLREALAAKRRFYKALAGRGPRAANKGQERAGRRTSRGGRRRIRRYTQVYGAGALKRVRTDGSWQTVADECSMQDTVSASAIITP